MSFSVIFFIRFQLPSFAHGMPDCCSLPTTHHAWTVPTAGWLPWKDNGSPSVRTCRGEHCGGALRRAEEALLANTKLPSAARERSAYGSGSCQKTHFHSTYRLKTERYMRKLLKSKSRIYEILLRIQSKQQCDIDRVVVRVLAF